MSSYYTKGIALNALGESIALNTLGESIDPSSFMESDGEYLESTNVGVELGLHFISPWKAS